LLRENDFLEGKYKMMFDAPQAKAHPFLIYQGKLYVGDVKAMHANLLIQKFDSDDLAYSGDGRIWAGPKIITFWEWPNNLKSFLSKLTSEASKQQGIKIDLKTWKLEVKDPDTKKLIYVPISDVLSKDTKLIKQGKSVILKHLVSPMSKEKEAVPYGMGSRKRPTGIKPGESPVQARYRIVAEAHQTRDKIYRMAAEQAFKSLLKEAKKTSSWKKNGTFATMETSSGVLAFGVLMEDVDVRFKDLVFLIHGSSDVRGVYARNVFPKKGGGSDIIDLNIIPNSLMKSIMSGKIGKSIAIPAALLDKRQLVMHEMQHYLSINKRQGATDNRQAVKAGSSEYYNSSEETNAYYQQGADTFEEMIKVAINDVDYARIIKRTISDKFPEFIKNVFNKRTSMRIWHGPWLDNLNDDNKRKFIKRVAGLYKKPAIQLYNL